MDRREFFASLAALQLAAQLDAQTSNAMIYRNLGRTGSVCPRSGWAVITWRCPKTKVRASGSSERDRPRHHFSR